MASTTTTTLVRCFLAIALLSYLFGPSAAGCSFDSIYSFGGGSAMADHLASVFHLPSPDPYAAEGGDFNHGASFVAAGSTVMTTAFFAARGIQPSPLLKRSFDAQVQSFTAALDDSVCRSRSECINKLQRALFFVDQIGANDYEYAFSKGKSIKEVSRYVPIIAQIIKNTIRKLIAAGATHLIVPGLPPMGCFPGYLTLIGAKNKTHSYSNNCHVGLNTFARLHNDHLRQVLMELQLEFPDAQIVYADYYKAFAALIRNHLGLGFKRQSLMEACCGFGDRNKFHRKKALCGGEEGDSVCSDPEKYIHWDGFHLTHEALKHVVEAFMAAGKGFVFPEFKYPEVTHCITKKVKSEALWSRLLSFALLDFQ
ncbi:acetylajmaline esterase [Sarracenia purpurea var. burkii]